MRSFHTLKLESDNVNTSCDFVPSSLLGPCSTENHVILFVLMAYVMTNRPYHVTALWHFRQLTFFSLELKGNSKIVHFVEVAFDFQQASIADAFKVWFCNLSKLVLSRPVACFRTIS